VAAASASLLHDQTADIYSASVLVSSSGTATRLFLRARALGSISIFTQKKLSLEMLSLYVGLELITITIRGSLQCSQTPCGQPDPTVNLRSLVAVPSNALNLLKSF